MLLKWGLKQAEEDHLPVYLESSQMGRPLYASLGFEPKYEQVWDLQKYGLEGTEYSTVMIKEN